MVEYPFNTRHLMFHCGFTGARLWNRSAFLMGLGKGISFGDTR